MLDTAMVQEVVPVASSILSNLREVSDHYSKVVTQLSEKALFHFDEYALEHKVLVLVEASPLLSEGVHGSLNLAIRSLVSEHKLTHHVTVSGEDGEGHTVEEKVVRGPIALWLATTCPKVHPELRSRVLEVATDESSDQTFDIVSQSLAKAANPVSQVKLDEVNRVWQAAFLLLAKRPVMVAIPPEWQLVQQGQSLHHSLRRDMLDKFVPMVLAHAYLNAHQREEVKPGVILATVVDYNIAKAIFEPFLRLEGEAPLDCKEQVLLDWLKENWPEGEAIFSLPGVRDLANTVGLNKSTVNRHITALCNQGRLVKQKGLAKGTHVSQGEAFNGDPTLFQLPTLD